MTQETLTDTWDPASVLVVDDEAEVANVLARGLTGTGYKVSVAHSGGEALERLEAGAFDLLLTDMHMPRMQGDELQRIARHRDPDLAVILITAAQDAQDAVRCMQEGASDYIVKPAPLADVSVRVQKALERRRLVLENRDYQTHLEERVAEQADRIRRMLMQSLETLSYALEAKDENTRNHSVRVAELVATLAGHLAPEDKTYHMRLKLAALLHDIGKIGVPEAILNKPGQLTPEEFGQIQKHPVIGETILRPMLGSEDDIMSVVRNHHERWDGGGYPDGLAGEDTPLGARIAAVADAYDAMTSARPYRPGMLPEQALKVLREGAGTQWDPRVVASAMELAAAGQFGQRPVNKPHAPHSPMLEGKVSSWAETTGSSLATRTPVIFVQDHLDEKTAEQLRIKVEALLNRGRNNLVLDMQAVQTLDRTAVLLLYRMHQMVEATGGRIVIQDATELAATLLWEAGVVEEMNFKPPLRHPSPSSRLSADC